MGQGQTFHRDPQDNNGWHDENNPLGEPCWPAHRPVTRTGAGRDPDVWRRSARWRARFISSERRSEPRAHCRRDRMDAAEAGSTAFWANSDSSVPHQTPDRARAPDQAPRDGPRAAMAKSIPASLRADMPTGMLLVRREVGAARLVRRRP